MWAFSLHELKVREVSRYWRVERRGDWMKLFSGKVEEWVY